MGVCAAGVSAVHVSLSMDRHQYIARHVLLAIAKYVRRADRGRTSKSLSFTNKIFL